jgi:ParB family chromosome partitioning protein
VSAKPTNRLGRGLSSLLGDVEGASAIDGIPPPPTMLPVELLEPGPFQPRGAIDDRTLDELTASIRQAGVLQPLLVRAHPTMAGRYQIIAGERRWRASQRARLDEVPVIVRMLGDSDAMAAALIENLQREDLNPVEEARGYQRLIDEFGLTHQALADALGKSRAHLTNTLRLLGLPAGVLEELAAGRLSAGHARAVLGAEDPQALAATVISEGLSVRQTEARAAARAEPRASTKPDYRDDPDVVAVTRSLMEELGLRVEIQGTPGRGKVVIHFTSPDELDGVLALLRPRG